MKKMYIIAATLFIGVTLTAQTIDFESHALLTESYDNGSAGGGDFMFGDLTFHNFYDVGYASWTGFAISNVTDNVTAGWANQYSAYPGTGANGSANYGVFYFDGYINGSGGFQFAIDSFKITNTSYAAISMRDGDAFAKQFGSPNDASGSPDGTNGEDYFRVWVLCEDEFGITQDSVEVYLADYRFSNNSLDYIVDTWINVDLTNLGFQVHNLTFRFESTDNGAWGMNTPAYFAIDDISTQWYIGLDESIVNPFKVYPNPTSNSVNIVGGEGLVELLDLSGNLVYSVSYEGQFQFDLSFYENAMYLIRVTNNTGVYMERLIKQ